MVMKFMVSKVINCHLYFSLLLLACQILKVSKKYIIYETMVAIYFIHYRITQRDACFPAFYRHLYKQGNATSLNFAICCFVILMTNQSGLSDSY